VGFYKGGKPKAFKEGGTWTMPKFPGLPVLYCRDISSDIRLVNQAEFNCQIIAPPSVYNGATATQVELQVEFWASYEFLFMVQDIAGAVGSEPTEVHVQARSGHGTISGPGTGDPYGVGSTFVANPLYANALSWEGLLMFTTTSYSFILGLAGYGNNGVAALRILQQVGGTNVSAMGTQYVLSSVAGGFSYNLTQVATLVVAPTNGPLTIGLQAADFLITIPGAVITGEDLEIDNISAGQLVSGGALVPYTLQATDEILWCLAVTSGNTWTAPTSNYLDISVQSFAIDPTDQVGLKYAGNATVEGMARTEFSKLTNEQRAEYKGSLGKYIRAVKEKMHPRKQAERLPVFDDIKESKQAEASRPSSEAKAVLKDIEEAQLPDTPASGVLIGGRRMPLRIDTTSAPPNTPAERKEVKKRSAK